MCQKCLLAWGLFNFLLRKSIQLLHFMLFLWVVPLLYVLHMLSAAQVRLLVLNKVFSTTHLFQCGKERGISKSWFAHIFDATCVFGHEYPTRKYFSMVVTSVALASCFEDFPISVMVLVLQKGGSFPVLSQTCIPHLFRKAVTLVWGGLSLDCCREMPCQSFILLPWTRLREDAFKRVGVFPKKLFSTGCSAASWREECGKDCLGTEWQFNSGKIKLLKGNSRKTYLR